MASALELLNSLDTSGVKLFDPSKAFEFYHRLSHSNITDFKSCPRRWQLTRFRKDRESTVHTAFGHAVGEAVANIAAGMELEDAIFRAFSTWEVELLDEIQKSKKSFAMAVDAIRSFYLLWNESLGQEWEVLYIDGNPAAELGLRIKVGEYTYRGFVDLVLKNRFTDEVAILECKTTGYKTATEAMFGNSNQSLGYAVVLDKIIPDLSSYTVLHLVYVTPTRQWNVFPVHKSAMKRANWIRDLVYIVRTIEMYKEDDNFPLNGSACTEWGRLCEFYGCCDQPTEQIISIMPKLEPEDDSKYHYTFTLEELIEQQLENVS